jgi:hypothetical protein
MSRHVDKRVISSVKSTLRSLEPEQQFLSAREAVAELEPDIRAAMKKGYTLEAIAERIREHIQISPHTLKGYLYGKDAVNRPAPAVRAKRTRKSA